MKESSDDSSSEEINKSDEEQNNKNLNHREERISLEELQQLNLDFENDSNMGRVGLINIGNTCFMNSALQCLSNCYELTKYFLSGEYEHDINEENRLGSGGRIAAIYNKLLNDLWLGNEDSINPSYFKQIFAHFVKKFSGYHQQDSNEFLIFLLDRLHEDLNSITKKPYVEIGEKRENETDEDASKRWWEKNLLRENSIIVDLFHGQFKSTITCGNCKRVSVSFDSYMFLSLPIPSGRFEINVKYIGYSLNEFFETSIPITENTTVQNIIDAIKMKLSIKNKKGVSNPPNKKGKRNKNKKNRSKTRIEENDLDDDSIEIVLLTKDNKLYKVFDSNDYIFPFIKKGYELVAYEKNGKKNENDECKRENIYFYLTKYYSNYLVSIFYNPKTLLYNYPLVISLDKNSKIYSIYSSIKKYLKELIPTDAENDKKEVLLEINNNDFYKNINKQNENNIKFLIYLNLLLTKKNNKSICESIFGSSKYINSRLLDYCSSVNDNIYELKSIFNLKSNDRLCLDINVLFDIDKTKFDNLDNNFQSISMSYSNNINLYDCLNLFNSEEILEGDNQWYCNKCKKHQDVTKKMDIYRSPYYLIIQLKRFKQDEMGQRSIFNIFNSSKNSTFIDFPTSNLDISKYLLSNNSGGGKYNLIGVINHYGGESFGHYTAYCYNNNKWCEYNDDSVSLINESKVVSNAAYVLFYKRINN